MGLEEDATGLAGAEVCGLPVACGRLDDGLFAVAAARFTAAMAAADAALVWFETFDHAVVAGDCFEDAVPVAEQV